MRVRATENTLSLLITQTAILLCKNTRKFKSQFLTFLGLVVFKLEKSKIDFSGNGMDQRNSNKIFTYLC